ncbi:hypothetical protein NDU88_008602 [Pleurodeles waltl]|uniref:Uncharacterized protein n=1 Tax=Pleurodeles waltl TaxID=8319 RepID=A0AAV7RTK0_PLEWA|nr:hypothetical protein NDU88_008602 [Pleurodeles waltl]
MHVGDVVVVKDRHPGWKFRTPYEPSRWSVVDVQGTMMTAQRGDQRVTRNVSWFKRLEGHDEDTPADAEEVDDVADHRMEPHEALRNDQNSSLSPEPVPDARRLVDLGGKCERYHLRPNPYPSQRL